MIELTVGGMTCAHCEAAVRRAVGRVAPDAAVEVDLAGGRVRVGGSPDAAAVRAAIAAEGYTVA